MAIIDTRQMRVDRHKLILNAKAILDKADAEKRSLTADDRVAHDKLLAEAGEQLNKIADIERRNDVEREEVAGELREEEVRSLNGGRLTGGKLPLDKDGLPVEDVKRLVFKDRAGNEYRSIKHGESYRDAIRVGRPDPEETAFLPKLIVARATGDWSGIKEEHRAKYAAGESVAGGYLLTAAMGSLVIDLARAQSVVSKAGAQTIAIPDNSDELHLAKVETDPVAYWTPERSKIEESEGTFGRVTLRARALCVFCHASIQLMRDAPNAGSLIQQTIAAAIALKFDESCLNGIGAAEEFTGLLNSTGITKRACTAGGINMDSMLDCAGDLWKANVEPAAMIYDANMRKAISQLKDGEGQYIDYPPELKGLNKLTTTQLSSTDANNCLYMGDFSNCIIGVRSDVEIEISPYEGHSFQRNRVGVRGMLRADFAICRSADICRLGGITGTT